MPSKLLPFVPFLLGATAGVTARWAEKKLRITPPWGLVVTIATGTVIYFTLVGFHGQ